MTDKQKRDFVAKWRKYIQLDRLIYEMSYLYQKRDSEELFEEKQKLIYYICNLANFYRKYNVFTEKPTNLEIYQLLVKSLVSQKQ